MTKNVHHDNWNRFIKLPVLGELWMEMTSFLPPLHYKSAFGPLSPACITAFWADVLAFQYLLGINTTSFLVIQVLLQSPKDISTSQSWPHHFYTVLTVTCLDLQWVTTSVLKLLPVYELSSMGPGRRQVTSLLSLSQVPPPRPLVTPHCWCSRIRKGRRKEMKGFVLPGMVLLP